MTQTIDDSTFALILRFAGFNQEISFNTDEFFAKQLEEIEAHVNQYQPEEQGERILRWIEQYASEYRKIWNQDIVAKKVSDHQCPDCPLQDDNTHGHCQIHDQWVELLQKYVANEISSQEYVEKALSLLTTHKEDLRIKLSALPLQQ
ncbi:MAG: hypothetical protein GQ563_00800 [Desulfuromusa sp.]|nr:hypothetical protein [Desulfuromusa sp.]